MKLTAITKQYNLGVRFGALRILVGQVMFYVSMANFVMISVVAYDTTLRAVIQAHFPWFNFPLFIGIMAFLVLVAMVLEYKFVVPSTTSYGNVMWYRHQNPAKADLELILKKLEELEAKIK